MMLSRLQLLIGGQPAPWTKDLAVELQTVMDRNRVAVLPSPIAGVAAPIH